MSARIKQQSHRQHWCKRQTVSESKKASLRKSFIKKNQNISSEIKSSSQNYKNNKMHNFSFNNVLYNSNKVRLITLA